MPADQVLADYDRWLERQALAARTRTSYRRWVGELVEHLAGGDELKAFLAPDGEHDRRAVLGDWRRRLVDRGLAPSTVNLALAAGCGTRSRRGWSATTAATSRSSPTSSATPTSRPPAATPAPSSRTAAPRSRRSTADTPPHRTGGR